MRLALVLLVGCNVPAVDYLVVDAAPPMTTFRDGLDGYGGTSDTYIDNGLATTSFGTSPTLMWSTTNNKHALLRFDGIMDRIPGDATIRDALLELFILESGSTSGMLYEITGNWDESTTYNTFGATPGVQPTEDRGMQQIGLIDGSSVGPALIHVGGSISRWKQNPALNKGWVFIPNDPSGVTIGSSENPIEARRPGLTILYTE